MTNFKNKNKIELTNNNHNDISVRVEFGGVADSIVNFLGAVDFLHGGRHDFHWQELGHFVTDVEWSVEN